MVGEWLRDRPGVRERLVLVTKGAHLDGERVRVTPADIAADLRDSIERLGHRTGAGATAVALAWVLAQPFPTIAVIGPHSVEHLHDSLGALDVELGADELAWLNLEPAA